MPYLVAPDGSVISLTAESSASNASYTGNTNDAIPITLTQTGTYSLLYEGLVSNGVGGFIPTQELYDFRLLDTSGSAVAYSQGNSVAGTLTVSGDQTDIYTYQGTAGERIYVQNYDQYAVNFLLYGPNNELLAPVSDFSGDLLYTLPTTGTYLIAMAGDSFGGSLDYIYTLYFQDSVSTTTSLTLGSATTNSGSGNIGNYGDQNVFTFTANAGDAIYLDSLGYFSGATAGDYATYTLIGPNGDVIPLPTLSELDGDTGPINLAYGGTYTLVIGGDFFSGTYSFQILDTASAQSLDPLNTSTSPVTATATLATGYGATLYTFTGAAGETVFLDNTSNNYYTELELFGPGGQSLGSAQGYYTSYEQSYGYLISFSATLPEAGTYVVVFAGQGTASGTFSIYDTSVSKTSNITSGTTYSGTLAHSGDQAIYTYQGFRRRDGLSRRFALGDRDQLQRSRSLRKFDPELVQRVHGELGGSRPAHFVRDRDLPDHRGRVRL